jgi:hypothetical protein
MRPIPAILVASFLLKEATHDKLKQAPNMARIDVMLFFSAIYTINHGATSTHTLTSQLSRLARL